MTDHHKAMTEHHKIMKGILAETNADSALLVTVIDNQVTIVPAANSPDSMMALMEQKEKVEQVLIKLAAKMLDDAGIPVTPEAIAGTALH